MDKKKTNLREQDAPEKNTDKAFVRVASDGTPDHPGKDKKLSTAQKQEDKKRRK